MSLVRLLTRNVLKVNSFYLGRRSIRTLLPSNYSPLIPQVHPPLTEKQRTEIAASSDCWVGYREKCLRNEMYYFANRDDLLSKYKGKWLGFCDEKLISIDDHPYYVRSKLFEYHEQTGTTDEFVVFCGYEMVNTFEPWV